MSEKKAPRKKQSANVRQKTSDRSEETTKREDLVKAQKSDESSAKSSTERFGDYELPPKEQTSPTTSTNNVKVVRDTEGRGKRKANEIIAYVHSVSPIKRNKKNTIDYCDLVLQTSNETKRAICFSKSKRPILLDREHARTPVKISNFTNTPNEERYGCKLIINDMTKITVPESNEYSFQYSKSSAEPPFVPLQDVLDKCASMDVVSVCGKILSKSKTETVGKDSLKLAKVLLTDGETEVKVDVWENFIEKLEEGSTYTLFSVRVREWNGERKLSTTKECTIVANNDDKLKAIPFDPNTPQSALEDLYETINVSNFSSIQDVQKFIQCINCFRKILQVDSGLIVHCDRCGHSARVDKCTTQICVKVVITQEIAGERTSLCLTLFQNILEKLMSIDTNNFDKEVICETLLLLDNIIVTYNNNNKIITDINFVK